MAQLGGCDVLAGGRIQQAIDAAAPGSTIIVCAGIYAEELYIWKDDVTLSGDGAVLDGSILVGERHAVTIANSAQGFHIEGFEIRNYADHLDPNDGSSAFLSEGPDAQADIIENSIHDNGWAGVELIHGSRAAWTIANNTFADNGYASIVANDAQLRIESNDFEDTPQGLMLAGVRDTVIDGNTFRGGGDNAIFVGPSLGREALSQDLTITNNVVNGSWTNGIWALGGANVRVTQNVVQDNDTRVVLGGIAEHVHLSDNVFPRVYEVTDVAEGLRAFRYGPPEGYTVMTHEPRVLSCAGLSCVAHLIWAALDLVFPSAAASHAQSCASDVAVSCVEEDIEILVSYVTVVALALDDQEADASRLDECHGGSDACLIAEFMAPGQAEAPRARSFALASGVELRIIDIGVRDADGGLAQRLQEASLDAEWTPLVLCRLYVGGVPQPCLSEPRGFQFGLDVQWAQSDVDQHVSLHRLYGPTDAVYESFDRVHGADATLFKATTKPHHAASLPKSPLLPFPTDTTDTGKVYAGSAALACAIVTTSLEAHDCGMPTLVTQPTPYQLAWCPRDLAAHGVTTHEDILHEATLAWRWSASCSDVDAEIQTSWTELLRPSDRVDLATAHAAYFAAGTEGERLQNATAASNVLTRIVARHIALKVPTEGMPATISETELAGAVPTVIGSLPEPSWGAASAWTGQHAYLVHEEPHRDRILRYDPATGSTVAVTAQLDDERMLTEWNAGKRRSAIYDGRGLMHIFPASGPAVRVWNTTSNALWAEGESPVVGVSAVWDARARPLQGCPNGCAYIFGGWKQPTLNGDIEDDGLGIDEEGIGLDPQPNYAIYQYEPQTMTFLEIGRLSFRPEFASVVWDGERAHIIGGAEGSQPKASGGLWWKPRMSVTIFEPDTRTVTTGPYMLPEPRAHAAAYYDGEAVYLLGGESWDEARREGTYPLSVIRYHPVSGTFSMERNVLPRPAVRASAVWTGTEGLLFGGLTTAGHSVEVLRYAPTTGYIAQSESFADFTIADLTWTGLTPNLKLDSMTVDSLTDGWLDVDTPGLVAFTPVRLNLSLEYTTLAGEVFERIVTILIDDENAEFTPPVIAEYAGKIYGDAVAVDADNIGFTELYLDTSAVQARTLLLANASTAPDVFYISGVSFDTSDDVEAVALCLREIWTAQANGTLSNVDLGNTLGVQNTTTCTTHSTLDRFQLKFPVPVSLTLEIRRGATDRVWFSIVDDPFDTTLEPTVPPDVGTLLDAAALPPPSAFEASIQPVAARIILELSYAHAPGVVADVLAELLGLLAPAVGIFAVEIDDVPLTASLKLELEEAVEKTGVIVITGAGVLPLEEWDTAAHDKLMTISGLAAHPLVLTIGGGDVQTGVSNWSRLGPTSLLTPKPDLVAPSPLGTTAGAVANVLPFVEALVIQGLSDVHLVRALLAGYAVPIRGQSGAPATYWEQGMGSVDLGAFIELPSLDLTLDLLMEQLGFATRDDAAEYVAQSAGTTVAAIQQSPSRAVVGLAGTPGALLRSAVDATQVRLVLDAPAFPSSMVVDFGVVNHETPGYAYFKPVDLDRVVGTTVNAIKHKLAQAGYGIGTDDETDLGNILADLTDNMELVTETGQDVTISTRHYYLFDLLEKDLLYTSLNELLDAVIADSAALPPGATPAATQSLRDSLQPWLLDEHRFTEDTSTRALTDVTLDPQCNPLPIAQTLALARKTVSIIQAEYAAEARRLGGAAPPMPGAGAASPVTQFEGRYVVSQANQLMCLEDQRELLRTLRDHAEAVRAIKRLPNAAFDFVEAESGAWGATPLGQTVASTLPQLDITTPNARQEHTIVLDVTMELLTRSIEALEGKLALIRTPKITASAALTPGLLETLPEATVSAPLGPYVGLAMVTSHDVTVYNPFTREAVATRDLTIPVPSFLWNNPTLTWTNYFRDGTPYRNQFMALEEGDGRIFEHTSRDVTTQVIHADGSTTRVFLGADASAIFDEDIARATSILERIDAALGSWTDIGIFDESAHLQTEKQRQLTSDAKADLEAARADLLLPTSPAVDAHWGQALAATLTSLYSHLDHQKNVTDSSGEARLPDLFPGSYYLFNRYPYGTRTGPAIDYPYANPGSVWFEGPMQDVDLVVARAGYNSTGNLESHPSADQEPITRGHPFRFGLHERQGGTRLGPFHQFGLDVHGADLLGIACLDIRQYSARMDLDLSLPGCGRISLPIEHVIILEEQRAYLHCALTGDATGLSEANANDCLLLHEFLNEGKVSCLSIDGCVGSDLAEELRDLLEEVLRLLDLGSEQTTLPVPWVRSPTRIIATQDKEQFGLTVDELLEPTRELPENQADRNNEPKLRAAIQSALDDLLDIALGTIDVDEPERLMPYDYTLANGILHRATDKISGLDWFHVGLSAQIDTTGVDPQLIEGELRHAASLVERDEDRDHLLAVAAALSTDSDLAVQTFTNAVHSAPASVAAKWNTGWRANGTLTSEGLRETMAPGGAAAPPPAACEELAAYLAAVPRGFGACEGALPTVQPTVTGLAGVDRAGLANALLEAWDRSGRPDNELVVADPPLAAAILSEALANAPATPERVVYRTQDAMRLEVPSVQESTDFAGVMFYTLPLPPNEYLRYTVEMELYLKNSAALVVTSANPLAAPAIMHALEAFDPETLTLSPQAGLAGVLQVVSHFDTTIAAELTAPDALTRYDLIGLPVGIESRAEEKPGGIEARGIVTLEAGTLHRYSKLHEMNTKGRGGATGPGQLNVFIIYFPMYRSESEVGLPKFQVTNASIAYDTFLGWGSGTELTCKCWGFQGRTGFRTNVEEWTAWIAAPDQHLQTDTTPGLIASYQIDTFEAIGHSADRMRKATSFPTTSDGRIDGDLGCPDAYSPGRPRPRDRVVLSPSSSHFELESWGCEESSVYGLAPHDVGGRSGRQYSNPPKKAADAAQYWYNVADIETQSRAMRDLWGQTQVSPYNAPLGLVPVTALSGGSSPVGIGGSLLVALEAVRGETTNTLLSLVGGKIIELNDATPFVQSSFIESAQHPGYPSPRDIPRAMHNYFTVTMEDVRAKLGPDYNRGRVPSFSYSDLSGGPEGSVNADFPTSRPGQAPSPLYADSYRAGVLAYKYTRGIEVIDQADLQRATMADSAELAFAHGKTGVGTAWETGIAEQVEMRDRYSNSFIRGHEFGSLAGATAKGYVLGGTNTGGSNCKNLPTYELMKAHARCTGWTARFQAAASAGAAGPEAECYDKVLAFNEALRSLALSALDREQQAFFARGSEESAALRRLATSHETTPFDATQIQTAAFGDAQMMAEFMVPLGELIEKCAPGARPPAAGADICIIPPVAGLGIEHIECYDSCLSASDTALCQFREAFKDLVEDATSHTARLGLATLSLAFRPSLTAEPPRLLQPRALLAAPAAAISAVGAHPVAGAIDQWTTNLTIGWYNATTTPLEGCNAPTAPLEVLGPSTDVTILATGELELVEGCTYTLSIVAYDDFGNRFENTTSFMSDITIPAIPTAPEIVQYVNGATTLAWTMTDAHSGVARASIEQRAADGAWTAVVGPVEGASTTLQHTFTPALSADSTIARFRLRVVDEAGNQNTAETAIHVDFTPPTIAGIFLDATPEGITTKPYFRWQIRASDPFSGIASASGSLETDSGGTLAEPTNTTANGNATVTFEGNDSVGLRDFGWLNGTATDRAGNVANWQVVNVTAYEVAPKLELTMPRYSHSTLLREVELRLNATIPGHATAAPEWTNLTLSNATWSGVVANATGGGALVMTANVSTLSGEYTLTVASKHSRATTRVALPLVVEPPVDELPLVALDTLSTIQIANGVNAYRFQHHHHCGANTFSILVESLAGIDVDLYVNSASGAPPTRSDYAHKRESASSSELIVVADAVLGQWYSVLVATKAEPTAYYLRYGTPGCGGAAGVPQQDSPLATITYYTVH